MSIECVVYEEKASEIGIGFRIQMVNMGKY